MTPAQLDLLLLYHVSKQTCMLHSLVSISDQLLSHLYTCKLLVYILGTRSVFASSFLLQISDQA